MSPEVPAALQLRQKCEYFDKSEGALHRLDNIAMKALIGYEDSRSINGLRTLHDFCMGTLQKNYRTYKGSPLTNERLQAIIES